MKGSTVDAMGEAVDNAEVMLFCVSLEYKGASLYTGGVLLVAEPVGLTVLWLCFIPAESANCRLECQVQCTDVPILPLAPQRSFATN